MEITLPRKYAGIACVLLCVFLIVMSWIFEFFGFPLPKGVSVASALVGAFGLFFLLVVTLKVYLD
jgi:hypothetical protein